MRKSLEVNAIEFTMGPSYMEDDIREATSRLGFCEKHLDMLYQTQNRLGLALILKTHMDKTIKDIEKLSGSRITPVSLFKKKSETPEVVTYMEQLDKTCFICDKIDGTFERYIATVFHLYSNSEDFRRKFEASRGFCANHYKTLYEAAAVYLSGEKLSSFIKVLNQLYLDNMKRVRDDLEWFINKFDYRFANEPWKNSKDALPRSMQKTNGILNK
jgi:nitrate/nitrite-specific signal transduction histidine kinase